jgi:diadenosine tetraphosphate (Ap4A) HIT family hydrolase
MGRHSSGAEIDWRADRVGSARRGENPMVLARMPSGWAVMGDTQFLPGYCVLLSDPDGLDGLDGGADHLTDLPMPARTQFLTDMSLLGQAMITACTGLDPSFRRVNYEILGNTDRYLHAHLFPRYNWEDPELLPHSVARGYPLDRWTSPRDAYSAEHEPLREAITTALQRLLP